MVRSRSRTPPRRERRRSRSTSRERERRRRERERSRSRDRDRRRSRSRSPHRRRSRSPPRRHRSSSLSPTRQKDSKDSKEKTAKPIEISEEDMEGKTEEEIEMMKLMGFGNFNTTKGRKTDGSVNAFAVNTTMKRKYRQYMNRKGGFNRPLDFIA
ncbi:U4/U6.U5 small nuclear ribonucleoprotein 27 kDa protein [Embiotoca jacksoni]|uniref:U4/U6.U5 small nuclear ribonucleoprotein 27 kDa protein n=1 Tax=Embiotoca jacksoni TaxID=100190 RepID=UPI003703E181